MISIIVLMISSITAPRLINSPILNSLLPHNINRGISNITSAIKEITKYTTATISTSGVANACSIRKKTSAENTMLMLARIINKIWKNFFITILYAIMLNLSILK